MKEIYKHKRGSRKCDGKDFRFEIELENIR